MKQREELYDKMKGIGMLLLFWGHLYTYGSIPFSLIFAFHMPLFFFLAGIFFKPTSMSQCLIKCYNRYILPYLFFWLLGIFVVLTKCIIGYDSHMIKKYFSSTIYNLAPDQGYVGSIWFLPVLAMSLAIANVIVNSMMHQSNKLRCVVIIVLSLGSILLAHVRFHILQLTTLCATTLFVYLGFLCRDVFLKIVRYKYSKLIAIALIPIFIVLSIINKTVNIAMPVYNNFLLYMACALIGIFITAVIADMSICRVFAFWGKNSLPIFCTHGFIIAIYTYLLGFHFGEPIRGMENIPDVWSFAGGLIILLISIPMYYIISPILNNFVKFLSYR